MASEDGEESRFDTAARRLDRAASLLGQRIARRLTEAKAQGGSVLDVDRAQLAAELDAARSREKALEAAGAEASAALADAIAELEAAIIENQGGGRA
jgi:hypothetical protein